MVKVCCEHSRRDRRRHGLCEAGWLSCNSTRGLSEAACLSFNSPRGLSEGHFWSLNFETDLLRAEV